MITINNRDTLDWFEGMTVRDVFDAMNYTYALITVTVNGTLVPPEDYDHFQIPDGADMKAIHIHHGG